MKHLLLLLIVPFTVWSQEASTETRIQSPPVDLTGKVSMREVYLENDQAPYSYENRNQYDPEPKDVLTNDLYLSYTFLPHYCTQIMVKVDR